MFDPSKGHGHPPKNTGHKPWFQAFFFFFVKTLVDIPWACVVSFAFVVVPKNLGMVLPL